MKIYIHPQSDKFVVFQADSLTDVKVIEEFPGLVKLGDLSWYCPNRYNVLYNIDSRLGRMVKLDWPQEVRVLLSSPQKIPKLDPDFKFYTKPKDFQEIALRYMNHLNGGGLLMDPGMGKTKVVLDFIAYRKFDKALIVCPKPLLAVWLQEVEKHRPDINMYVVGTTDWEKEREAICESQVVVINYNKAVAFCSLKDFTRQKWQFLGLDEGLIKNHTTQRTKALTKLGEKVPIKCVMSGTLVNNSALDIFAPIRFLEPALVGTSYRTFAKRYSWEVTIKKTQDGPIKAFQGTRRHEELKALLQATSVVMTKDEWLKLPPKTFVEHIVQLGDLAREDYYFLAENWTLQVDEGQVNPKISLSVLGKLTQIGNGFLYLDDEDELEDMGFFPEENPKPVKKKRISAKNRKIHYYKHQPKIDKMISLLEKELRGRRVMIWYNLAGEQKLITDALKAGGITYLLAEGGDKNINKNIDTFNRDPNVRCLVCQAKTINYGVTVLGKDYDDEDEDLPIDIVPEVFTQIFYSLNFSLEVFLQQQDRIHRLGQEFPCEYHLLLANTPTEDKVKTILKDKLSVKQYMMEDVIHSLRGLPTR